MPVRDAVRLSEYIITLLLNPRKREQMGQASAQIAKQYTWSAVADQLLNIFDDVVKSSASSISPHKN